MQFLERKGNFMHINIAKWAKFNGKKSYNLYYDNEHFADSTTFKSYTILISDIASSFITKESGKYIFYIVGQDGYMSSFIGTIDSIEDIHTDFTNVIKNPKTVTFSTKVTAK